MPVFGVWAALSASSELNFFSTFVRDFGEQAVRSFVRSFGRSVVPHSFIIPFLPK